ncbi:MAG: prepilin-type N-terminal cleavage/methylation domain-containing protein, partial [Bythopirellula sp.]
MNKPQAFTLVEMLVCISMGSVLMGLALTMVHRTMRIEFAARSNSQVERTAIRLSSQFRHDVHRAQTASRNSLQAGAVTVRLVLPGERSIVYQLEQNIALRQQQRTAGQTQRESFVFPEDYHFQVEELTNPARLALILERDPQLIGVSPQRRLHVEAVVGQFLQLIGTEEE